MRRKRDPVPRARDSWVWLGGILLLGILGAGVVGASTLLWERVDIRQIAPELAETPPPPPVPLRPAPGVVPEGAFPVALLRSPASRDFFPDTTWYDGALEQWAGLAEAAGGRVREVSPDDLGQLPPEELLMVPEAPCLTVRQQQRIQGHLDRGGGVVANWAFGARDGDCRWRSWNAVGRLAGSPDVREIPPREAIYLTVPGGLALSAGLNPGTRIELRGEAVLALGEASARVYWSDWALNPAGAAPDDGTDAAAVTRRTGSGGRVAWFGFRLGQGATPRDAELLERLVRNGILWSAGRPVASVSPWPAGLRAALLPVLEVETRPRSAIPVSQLLREQGAPATFFAVTQLVKDDPELARALRDAGELGVQTTDHRPLRGRTVRDQEMTLRRTVAEIRSWADTVPAGLRPPEEGFDRATLLGWQRTGGRYLMALNEARSAGPELHAAGRDTLVVIPRLMKDDYNVFVQDGALLSERLAEAWTAGLDKLGSLGGVAVMAGHTQILNTDGRLSAFRAVLEDAMGQGEWWVATGEEVAEWWRTRSHLQITWVAPADSADSAGTLELMVSAPEDRGVDHEVWLDIALPAGPVAPEPSVDGDPVRSVLTPWGIRLPVGPLAPGQSRRVTLQEAT